MSQTWKDSGRKSTDHIVLEVMKNDDGTYEITVNGEVVDRRNILWHKPFELGVYNDHSE